MTKKIYFEQLSLENFLSVGKKPVVVDFIKGLHVITGINRDLTDRRNGIGKSTIIDALNFVLFGTTLRDLKKEFIVNNITKGTARISLKFSVQENKKITKYEVCRTLDPSKCFLYENGVDITRDSMVNTTDFLQELLRLNPEVFQNCIALTLNNMVPFMAKKKIEKRKFIESIFNLEIFSEMNSHLKTDLLEARREIDIKNGKYEEKLNVLNGLIKQKEDLETDRAKRKATLNQRLDEYETALEGIKGKIEKIQLIDLDPVNEKISLVEEKIKEINSKINVVGKDITLLETKRDFLKSNLLKIGTEKDACPVCLKPVTTEDKNHIRAKKDGIKSEIKDFEEKIKSLDGKLSIYQESVSKLEDAQRKLRDIVSNQKVQIEQKKHLLQKQKDINIYIDNVKKDLEELETSVTDNSNLLKDVQEKANILNQELENLRKNLSVLEIVKFVLGEDGVRSFIVKKILVLFNNRLSYYLRKLNSNAFIKFDEYFEDIIVNNKGVNVSYFNFSGAEKKVIDLAIMFTFIEMLRMQGNVIYNIQMYDELLDTSLDEVGVEMVVGLLTEISNTYNYGIYLISHRKECAKLSTGDVIFLEKKEGITTRIKYVD